MATTRVHTAARLPEYQWINAFRKTLFTRLPKANERIYPLLSKFALFLGLDGGPYLCSNRRPVRRLLQEKESWIASRDRTWPTQHIAVLVMLLDISIEIIDEEDVRFFSRICSPNRNISISPKQPSQPRYNGMTLVTIPAIQQTDLKTK